MIGSVQHKGAQQAGSLASLVARMKLAGGFCHEADQQQLQSRLDETSAEDETGSLG